MKFQGANVDHNSTILFNSSNIGNKVNFLQTIPPPPPTWDIVKSIAQENESYSIDIGGTSPNIIIDWGDGNLETFTTIGQKSHTYTLTGNYTIKIHGSFQSNGVIRTPTIESTSVLPYIPGLISCDGMFFAGRFTTIPEGLFDNNPDITAFSFTFQSCSNLVSIPTSLFDNQLNTISFDGCFANLTLDTTSYSNLLINMASNASSRQNDVSFGAGSSKYNLAGQTARQTLEAKNWTFADGGLE
jgi:PKD repeat protein